MVIGGKKWSFKRSYGSMAEVLNDHKLASLGDAYINFVYSLALSNRTGKPTGMKVKGSMLAEALRKAGLRGYLPSGMTRHTLADAVEALLVFAWINDHVSLGEMVTLIERSKEPVEGLSEILLKIRKRVTFP